MKSMAVLVAATATIFLGCPGGETSPPDISEDCALEYAVAIIDVAPSECVACEASLLAVDDDTSEWDEYHRLVWENPSEDLLEQCGSTADVRVELLSEEQLLRFYDIASCNQYEPDDC